MSRGRGALQNRVNVIIRKIPKQSKNRPGSSRPLPGGGWIENSHHDHKIKHKDQQNEYKHGKPSEQLHPSRSFLSFIYSKVQTCVCQVGVLLRVEI